MSPPAFDGAAEGYDRAFTDTAVGRAQRAAVWRHLEERVLTRQELAVLELGCGTGEDALRLAALGHRVHAVDASEGMLAVARRKAVEAGLAARLRLEHRDLRQLGGLEAEGPFDLALSDFGPLNCLEPKELARLGATLTRLVRPGGRAVLVVMPRGCPWEWAWFGLRGRPRQALRRLRRGPVAAPVEGSAVDAWYHGPRRVLAALGGGWRRRHAVAVGLFVPPSYLDPLVARRPRLLAALVALDRALERLPGAAALADHCLVDAERRPEGVRR